MRLFIAIQFPEEIKDLIDQTVQNLKKHAIKGNFTLKDNLHLTLAFIGENEKDKLIEMAMKQAIANHGCKKFSLGIEGMGKFKRTEGDIYWLGVKQILELVELNKVLVKELNSFGFAIEEREFKPHLTLGRLVKIIDHSYIKQLEQSIPPINIAVNKISLMKSERIAGKLVYTEIFHCDLPE